MLDDKLLRCNPPEYKFNIRVRVRGRLREEGGGEQRIRMLRFKMLFAWRNGDKANDIL